jgi:hypothetical protein
MIEIARLDKGETDGFACRTKLRKKIHMHTPQRKRRVETQRRSSALFRGRGSVACAPKRQRPRIRAVRLHPASLTQNRGRKDKRAFRLHARPETADRKLNRNLQGPAGKKVETRAAVAKDTLLAYIRCGHPTRSPWKSMMSNIRN